MSKALSVSYIDIPREKKVIPTGDRYYRYQVSIKAPTENNDKGTVVTISTPFMEPFVTYSVTCDPQAHVRHCISEIISNVVNITLIGEKEATAIINVHAIEAQGKL